MKFRLASASVGMLLKAVDQPTFDFYGKTQMNQPEQRARWSTERSARPT